MTLTRVVVACALVLVVAGCGAKSTQSLFDQLGGIDQIRSLSDALVNNVSSDPRTSKLLSDASLGPLKTKMSDQLCAVTGGGCKAPLTNVQVAEAAKKVDASTSRALNDSLSRALELVRATPGVKEGVTKLVGPQLGGIVAGLL